MIEDRDEFAMAALTGLLASGKMDGVTETAYILADEMLKEREIDEQQG